MIEKRLTAYCDECANSLSLLVQDEEQVYAELLNNGWNRVNGRDLCSDCDLKRLQTEVNGPENA